jgi:hypothetical protein
MGLAPAASKRTAILLRGNDLRSALSALLPEYVAADDRVIYRRPTSC